MNLNFNSQSYNTTAEKKSKQNIELYRPGMLSMGFDVTKTKIHRKASNAATKALATVLVNGKTEQTPLKPKQVMNDDESTVNI